ncbi:Kunitz/Bovine pancreatic trypsin inhibitor domain protein, partial [Ostertagia ostertagi]
MRSTTTARCWAVVALLRWHYEPSTRQCHLFVFHGFQGNQNNFESLEECESTCRDVNPCEEGIPVPSIGDNLSCSPSLPLSCPTGSFCKLRGSQGFCCPEPTKTIKHPVSDSVRPGFLNSLFFLLFSGQSPVDELSWWIFHYNYGMPSECLLPQEAGYGLESSHRWSFDATTSLCVSFIYNGYGGNQNNFLSRNDCETA